MRLVSTRFDAFGVLSRGFQPAATGLRYAQEPPLSRSNGHPSAWFHDDPQRGALLTLDGQLHEVREADDVDAVQAEVLTRDGSRLHRLVHGPRADGSNLDPAMVPHHPGDGPCCGRRLWKYLRF